MKAKPRQVVVTRHAGLRDWLLRRGIISETTEVIAHATEDDVRDAHVVGVLPLSLAALAATVTEVPLRVPAELRGQELTAEQVEQFRSGPIAVYEVRVNK